MQTLTDQSQRQLDSILTVPSGSYIFHGPAHATASATARDLARRLNCLGEQGASCAHCKQFAAGAYPDFLEILPAEGKQSLTIEQIRALISNLSLSLYRAGGRRIVLIDNAETLTEQAQNALLKIIEEPPAHTIFILITASPTGLLPTVRSRCAHLYFAGAADVSTDDLDGATRIFFAGSVFERLLEARRLIDSKADLTELGTRLQKRYTSALTQGQLPADRVATALSALEEFRHFSAAKVSLRPALEKLALEL